MTWLRKLVSSCCEGLDSCCGCGVVQYCTISLFRYFQEARRTSLGCEIVRNKGGSESHNGKGAYDTVVDLPCILREVVWRDDFPLGQPGVLDELITITSYRRRFFDQGVFNLLALSSTQTGRSRSLASLDPNPLRPGHFRKSVSEMMKPAGGKYGNTRCQIWSRK